MTTPFMRGQIVRVRSVLDPQGRNPKSRPCVVVQVAGDVLLLVGVSSELGDMPAADRVDIAYSNDRPHPVTGLDRPSAALCTWQTVAGPNEVIEVMGVVAPPAGMLHILARVNALLEARRREQGG